MAMSNKSKGDAFEKEVELLFRLRGYEVKRNFLISGTQIDLVAIKNDIFENICFIIECTNRKESLGVDIVKQKSSILLSNLGTSYIYKLIIVVKNDITAEAKAYAESFSNLSIFKFSELEQKLINFEPYYNWYKYNYESSSGIFEEGNLFDYYIELRAKDENDKQINSITDEAITWLKSEKNNLLFLLGEFGIGKSSFCRHFVYEILSDNTKDTKYIPLLINLREYKNSKSLKQVITDTLINLYGVTLHSFLAFERVCAGRNLLLVLDGFDEMVEKSDKKTLLEIFGQVYTLATINAKIILTCRSNLFKYHNDIIQLLNHFQIEVPEQEKQRYGFEPSFNKHGKLLYIERLDKSQVFEFIKKRFGDETEDILRTIDSIHDLSDLSSRPVLLDMILKTLPELTKSTKKIYSSSLYEFYTDKWVNRDEWRVNLPLEVRHIFCESLAWVFHINSIQEIEVTMLERIIQDSLGISQEDEKFQMAQNDIKTCSFLVRTSKSGNFSFAHKSFIEYFVSRKLITNFTTGEKIVSTKKNDDQTNFKVRLELFERYLNQENLFHNNFSQLFSYKLANYKLFSSNWVDNFLKNRNQLEKVIERFLTKDISFNESNVILISEEIATFCTEYIVFKEIDINKLIKNLERSDDINVFCEIVRKSKSNEFTLGNEKYIKKYILSEGGSQNLKIAFVLSLIRVPELINYEFVVEINAYFSKNTWSYILFELSKKEIYKEILNKIDLEKSLRNIDKIICGLVNESKSDNYRKNMTSLVLNLMESADENDWELALIFSNYTEVSLKKIINRYLDRTFETTFGNVEKQKKSLQMLNNYFRDDLDWEYYRTIAARVDNPDVRKLFYDIEKNIRDIKSKEKNKDYLNRKLNYKWNLFK